MHFNRFNLNFKTNQIVIHPNLSGIRYQSCINLHTWMTNTFKIKKVIRHAWKTETCVEMLVHWDIHEVLRMRAWNSFSSFLICRHLLFFLAFPCWYTFFSFSPFTFDYICFFNILFVSCIITFLCTVSHTADSQMSIHIFCVVLHRYGKTFHYNWRFLYIYIRTICFYYICFLHDKSFALHYVYSLFGMLCLLCFSLVSRR